MAGRRRAARTLAPLLADRVATAWRGGGWARMVLLRRAVAGLLIILAAVLALSPAVGSAPGATVVVAARDLAPGTVLGRGALTERTLPADAVPDGAVARVGSAAGRMLVAPLRRGEPLTDVRLAGAELARVAAADPGAVSVPLRLSDPDVAALLHPGATVDVVTLGERQDKPVVLARGATVLAVVDAGGSAAEGRLVLVALEPDAATRVAGASLSGDVTVTVR